MKKNSYIFSADVVRTVAIFGVLIIHTANAVYSRLDFFGGISWWFGIILESLSRISIPLFIMLSGYLLLSRNESFEKSLKRLLNRILIPLLFWTGVYMLWGGGKYSIHNLDLSYFMLLFSGNAFHLYFLIIMIGLYMVSSPLRSYLQKTSANSQKYFMAFFLIAGMIEVLAQYLLQMCANENLFTMWFPYTGLFIAGYYLGNKKFNLKKITLPFVFLISFGITIALNYFHYFYLIRGKTFLETPGCITYYSDYYLSLNVVLMSIAAFVFLLNFNYRSIENNLIGKFIYSVARTSFAIYIIHLLIVEFADNKLNLFTYIAPAWLYIVVKWTTVFIVSYLFSIVLIKTPIIKRLFGETK